MQKETVTFDKLRVEKNGVGTSTTGIRQTRVG